MGSTKDLFTFLLEFRVNFYATSNFPSHVELLCEETENAGWRRSDIEAMQLSVKELQRLLALTRN